MVLSSNIPEEVESMRALDVLEDRLPDFCHDCGGEIVIAGGRLDPEMGWYEHIDPVLMCERGCWRDRFTAGLDQLEGQEFREAPGAEDWSELFGDVAGYCDMHDTAMKPTKDLVLASRRGEQVPVRQFKCPECDRETTVTVQEEP